MLQVLKKCVIVLSFLIFGCSSVSFSAASDNTGNFDNLFLKGKLLYDNGSREKAADIFSEIAAKTGDSYLYIKVSDIYKDQNNYSKALEILKKGTSRDSTGQKDRLYYNMSILSFENLEQLDKAKKYIKSALKIEKKDKYLKLLAKVYTKSNDFSKAVSIYDELIENNNDNSEYYLRRGKLYLYLDLSEKAVNDLKKAVKLSKNLEAALLLGDYYLKSGGDDQAIKYLELVKDKHPGLIVPELKLAELYQNREKYQRALSYYGEIVDKIEGERKIYVLKQMGKIHMKLGNYQSVTDVLGKALEMDAGDTQSAFFMAVAFEAMGQWDKAEKYYLKTLDIRSDYTQAKKRLSYVYMQTGKFDDALGMLEKVSDVYRDVDFYRLKANVYEKKNSFEKALETLGKGLEENPESEELLVNKAFVLEKSGNFEEAEKVLKRILEINPKNSTALNFLAYFYADRNIDIEKALKLVNRALKTEPGNPAYLDTKAWTLYRMGKYEKAKNIQERALELAPEEKELQEHMEAIQDALDTEKNSNE